jgi:hypothetical protein
MLSSPAGTVLGEIGIFGVLGARESVSFQHVLRAD